MYRFQREQLAHNPAETIDDVYAQALDPSKLGSRSNRHRRVALVAKSIERAMIKAWQQSKTGKGIDDEEVNDE
jgi:hypothetical protein